MTTKIPQVTRRSSNCGRPEKTTIKQIEAKSGATSSSGIYRGEDLILPTPVLDTRSRTARQRRRVLITLLLLLFPISCQRPVEEPSTINYLRLGWVSKNELPAETALSEEFERETGVRLRHLRGVQENAIDQLALARRLLRERNPGPDVLEVDVTWLGVLQDDLADLKPYFPNEISSINPGIASSYVIGGKLVAVPYQNHVGILKYRADLLAEYGYKHPPKSWAELEKMAVSIQNKERAKGRTHFWGYVWPAAGSEALTCNALEWQVDEGGGKIIEDDGTISVNNPSAIKAWQRAKRWIGWISPPGVVEYREADAAAVFDAGEAAFARDWGGEPGRLSASDDRLELRQWGVVRPLDSLGYAAVPGGSVARAGTLGGLGLAISKYSVHPQEDAALIQFLIQKQIELMGNGTVPNLTKQTVVYGTQRAEGSHQKAHELDPGVVSRPSSVAGRNYEQVTRAYFGTVHSVLTGERTAPAAATELERQLVEVTGLKTGAPKETE